MSKTTTLTVLFLAVCGVACSAEDGTRSTVAEPVATAAPFVPAPVAPAAPAVPEPAVPAAPEPAVPAAPEPAVPAAPAPVTGPPVGVTPPVAPPPYCEGKPAEALPIVVLEKFVPSGWMGDITSIEQVAAPECNDGVTDTVANTACLAYSYSGVVPVQTDAFGAEIPGMAWAGVQFQHPPNNWDAVPGHCINAGATEVQFWARASEDGVSVKFGAANALELSVLLTPQWQQYSITLPATYNQSSLAGGVTNGFTWAAAAADHPDGMTVYISGITWL